MLGVEQIKHFDVEEFDWHFLFSIVTDTDIYFTDMLVKFHNSFIILMCILTFIVLFQEFNSFLLKDGNERNT